MVLYNKVNYLNYYFRRPNTIFSEYFYARDIIKQTLIEKDMGLPLYYCSFTHEFNYSSNQPILNKTVLNQQSLMQVYHMYADTFGHKAMLNKFVLNGKSFYVSNKTLVYLLNCLTTGQVIKNMSKYDDGYFQMALEILKEYNFEPIYYDYTKWDCKAMLLNNGRFVPYIVPFENNANSDSYTHYTHCNNVEYLMEINKMPFGELVNEDNMYYYVKCPYTINRDSNLNEYFNKKYPFENGLLKIEKINKNTQNEA